jgi:hypothetical protein
MFKLNIFNDEMNALDEERFAGLFPELARATPELFRSMSVASQSLSNVDFFGNPQGVRRDNGFEQAISSVLAACLMDHVTTLNSPLLEHLNTLRMVVLKWNQLTDQEEALNYFGYIFYRFHKYGQALVAEKLKYLTDVSIKNEHSQRHYFVPIPLRAWYLSQYGVGDKLSNDFFHFEDADRLTSPLSGYALHFKKSHHYNLKLPFTVLDADIEVPLVSGGKMVTACPQCQQKCRVSLFEKMEIKCPKCQGSWKQSA